MMYVRALVAEALLPGSKAARVLIREFLHDLTVPS